MSKQMRSLMTMLWQPFRVRRVSARVAVPMLVVIGVAIVAVVTFWHSAEAKSLSDIDADLASREAALAHVLQLRTEQNDFPGAKAAARAYLDEHAVHDVIRQKVHYELAAAAYCNGDSEEAFVAFSEVANQYNDLGLLDSDIECKIDDARFFVAALKEQQGRRQEALNDYINLYNDMPNSDRAKGALRFINGILMQQERKSWNTGTPVDNSEAVGANLQEITRVLPSSLDAGVMVGDYLAYLIDRGVNRSEAIATVEPIVASIRDSAPNTQGGIRATMCIANETRRENPRAAIVLCEDAVAQSDVLGDEQLRRDSRFDLGFSLREAERFEDSYETFLWVYENLPDDPETAKALCHANRTLIVQEEQDWAPVDGVPVIGRIRNDAIIEANVDRLASEHPGSAAHIRAMEELYGYYNGHRSWTNLEARENLDQRLYLIAEETAILAGDSEIGTRARIHMCNAMRSFDIPGALAQIDDVIELSNEKGYDWVNMDARIVKAHLLSAAGRHADARGMFECVLAVDVPAIDYDELRICLEAELKLIVAFTYTRELKYENALEIMQKIASCGSYSDSIRATSLVSCGSTQFKMGRKADAIKSLEMVMSLYPNTMAGSTTAANLMTVFQGEAE